MLKVGDKYEYEFSYTQQDVELFARVTGDNNPIHIDAEFAKTTSCRGLYFRRCSVRSSLGKARYICRKR